MAGQKEKITGIVVRSQEYKESDRLVTVFTAQGLLSLIVKGLKTKKGYSAAAAELFSHAEYLIRRGEKDLYPCREATLLDGYVHLRNEFCFLQAAGGLAQAIVESQWPGKESPALFSLYKAYHEQVVKVRNLPALLSSFYLKVLRLEGILSPCFEQDRWLPEEKTCLEKLLEVKSFHKLEEISIPPFLQGRIHQFFLELVKGAKRDF